MAKAAFDDDFIELELDRSGKDTFNFLKELPKRGEAFKRMIAYAAANDLLELVRDKIPGGRQYKRLLKNLKLGEYGKDGMFAVFVDNKSRQVNKVDAPTTLLYIKARRIRDKIPEDIQILVKNSPWTVSTIPFWPDKRRAFVQQRKVDRRTVQHVQGIREKQRDKIDRQLRGLGQKETDQAMLKKASGKAGKAMPDVGYEMLSLEFGGGQKKGFAIWRRSLKELPGRMKSVLHRYKRIQVAIGNPKSSAWKGWPRVDVKINQAQLKSFIKFQKMIGAK